MTRARAVVLETSARRARSVRSASPAPEDHVVPPDPEACPAPSGLLALRVRLARPARPAPWASTVRSVLMVLRARLVLVVHLVRLDRAVVRAPPAFPATMGFPATLAASVIPARKATPARWA